LNIPVTKYKILTNSPEIRQQRPATVTRDSTTVLLEGKTVPGKGFIHLYDSTPYMINAGHIALHVPCDARKSISNRCGNTESV
jgi:hypothetical protein